MFGIVNLIYVLCDMNTENYLQRHRLVDIAIKMEAKRVFKKVGVKPYVICAEIAKGKNVTPQTVHNYAKGKGKDGFLKEDILLELQKL